MSLLIKKLFLSFVQSYFGQNGSTYQWQADPKKTEIFIGDKFSARGATLEKYPAIIMNRGSKRWAKVAIDQRLGMDLLSNAKVRSDLVLGTMVFQCISTNGPEAEDIAEILFNVFVGAKDMFRDKGVNQLIDISMGEQTLLRSDTQARMVMVPVSVFYATQAFVGTSEDTVNLIVTAAVSADNFVFLQSMTNITDENTYSYTVTGLELIFNNAPPSGLTLSASYVDSITLASITETPSGVVDGYNYKFYLSHVPYSYYDTFEVFNLTLSGLTPTP